MFQFLYPDDYIASVYAVDFKSLYHMGYRGIIFDVDNTLVPHNAPADDLAKQLFCELQDIGYETLLLSNNGEKRVKEFWEDTAAGTYLYKAGKPKPTGYLRAMEKIHTTDQTTLFIGDQIFTDILGAKRAGIRTIMVKPVKKWKEEIQIILKRFLEAIVLSCYKRYCKKNGVPNPVPLKQ